MQGHEAGVQEMADVAGLGVAKFSRLGSIGGVAVDDEH